MQLSAFAIPGSSLVELMQLYPDRRPFTRHEIEFAAAYIGLCRDKGRDLHIDGLGHGQEEVVRLANDGALVLSSMRDLEASFLFLKLNAGQGFFGGQKAVYSSTIFSPNGQRNPGPFFKGWKRAVSSIGNIYRGHGYQ